MENKKTKEKLQKRSWEYYTSLSEDKKILEIKICQMMMIMMMIFGYIIGKQAP